MGELSEGSGGGEGSCVGGGVGVLGVSEEEEPGSSGPLEEGSSEETPGVGEAETPGEGDTEGSWEGSMLGEGSTLGEGDTDTAGPATWSEPPLHCPGRLLESYQPTAVS